MIMGLPEKIKDLRLAYGFSQKQVAQKLGVSPSIISGYETGERTPSLEVIMSMSYLYSCSVDFLLGKESDEKKETISVDGLNKNQIKAVAQLIETMRVV